MELTDREVHLLARLSRDRCLYAECKGADLDALQELGLLQWFDARSSSTPFKEDPRPLFKLLGISGRIGFFWVEPVENWRDLVGPEVSTSVLCDQRNRMGAEYRPIQANIGGDFGH